MSRKELLDKRSIYIPQKKMEERPVERLVKVGEKRDRSVNYLVVEAICTMNDAGGGLSPGPCDCTGPQDCYEYCLGRRVWGCSHGLDADADGTACES